MKTATLNDLQTRLDTIVAWVQGGEDVVVKGEPVAPIAQPEERKVDWTKSDAFRRDSTGEPVLTKQDIEELFEDMRGPY